MRLNSKQICEYTGGTLLVEPIDASRLACGISWDSRELAADKAFVALSGERTDGHRFVADALRGGAAVVVVADRPDAETCLLAKEMGAAVIEVSDTAHAVADLARAWRSKLRCRVIGVTGSNGKTTTKNMMRDVLKASFSVVATAGNQNNELGVPRTVLEANPETEVLIVEMGMRGPGQIKELCACAVPDMGLITNIGEGHLELLGTKEDIARAKAELFAALPSGVGIAFMNRDDAFADFVCAEAGLDERQVRLVWYGGCGIGEAPAPAAAAHAPAAVGAYADEVTLDAQGRPCFTLHLAGEKRRCLLPLRGIHNVGNATAAASVASVLGMDIDTIVAGLEKALPECGRQELRRARGGFAIIDDTYNANPDSMRAALLMLAALEVPGRRIAVLGDMGELGEAAQACHEGVGELAATLPLDRLICIGDLSASIASAAREGGMAPERVSHVESIAGILEELDISLFPEDTVLVKASRFMRLERVVEGLAN
ncbi:MAG: UDP-N-acetylmuramoyl-tripeptide--D-alanyl-D-alanine ligase [Eggerthellaceae bacterium]|nr:UDP-N-acetylmuramoyl-tripeptide--D-alanyl-D-alanine ligase [Eggerthellaceae bacterium]